MRRFIKTYTVRRHVQYSVVQDGDQRQFEVCRLAAEETNEPPELIAIFGYTSSDPVGMDRARGQAIAEAQRLAEADEAARQATGAM